MCLPAAVAVTKVTGSTENMAHRLYIHTTSRTWKSQFMNLSDWIDSVNYNSYLLWRQPVWAAKNAGSGGGHVDGYLRS
jgi:hypothetical protein